MTYKRILLAADNSAPAERATAEAIRFASAFDATLHAVYVLETGEPAPSFDGPATEAEIDTNAGRAVAAVESAATEQDFDGELVSNVLRGTTGPAILNYADEHDIDLVVMGTHGRDGLDRMIVGSVAEHVVRNASAPVVTVRAE
jgi:nucleotide-binding universal stress UspA family protein